MDIRSYKNFLSQKRAEINASNTRFISTILGIMHCEYGLTAAASLAAMILGIEARPPSKTLQLGTYEARATAPAKRERIITPFTIAS